MRSGRDAFLSVESLGSSKAKVMCLTSYWEISWQSPVPDRIMDAESMRLWD